MNQPIAIVGGCSVAPFDGGVQVPVKYTVSGSSASFVFPSVVMAVDFHDGATEESMCCSGCGYSWCEGGFSEYTDEGTHEA